MGLSNAWKTAVISLIAATRNNQSPFLMATKSASQAIELTVV